MLTLILLNPVMNNPNHSEPATATPQSEIEALTAKPIRLSGRMIEVEIIGGDSALQEAVAKKLQADFEARKARESLKLNRAIASESWMVARGKVNDAWEALRQAQAKEEIIAKEIEAINDEIVKTK